MALDYAKTAAEIVEKAGGKDNITTVAHCMTRLRFTVKNINNADQNAIRNIGGVLGVTYQGEQLQVVIGKNLIPVYDEVLKLGFKDGGSIDENLDADLDRPKEKVLQRLLGFVAGSVQPMIPVLIAGGMIKVFLLLFSKVVPGFSATTTYTLLSMLGNAPFYFMPILVAYGASKKLGGTPVYSMMIAAAMFAPDFLALIKAGDPMSMFGISVPLNSYASSLLPALLLAIVASMTEKFLNKVIPGVFKPIFVGMLTMGFTYFVTMIALAPVGAFVGTYVANALMVMHNAIGPVASALFVGILPYMIMTGMHTVLGPFMIQILADQGYDPFLRPGMLLHNMAEGGAVLGVAIRAKKKEIKAEAFSVAIGCIFAGVTEPAIYGFNLPLKKPLYTVSIGGAIAGFVGALLGAHSYEYGYSTILALPIFEDTIWAMAVAVALAIAIPCIITVIWGFDESTIAKNYQ